jgi:hypothetical protein
VVLAVGRSTPPGWWFDSSARQASDGWIALASAATLRRTKPMLILAGPFRAGGKFCWVAALPAEFKQLSDNSEATHQSRLLLFENGAVLGDGHREHANIASYGLGRYSFWSGTLYFSTSDNTDPNVNGRHYEIRSLISE